MFTTAPLSMNLYKAKFDEFDDEYKEGKLEG